MASLDSTEKLKKKLYKNIRKDKWDKVVEAHRGDRRAFTTRISGNRGDTAFMLAILEGKEKTVEKLVRLLTEDERRISEAKEIVRFPNTKLKTALHHAATSGNKEICKIIADVDNSLVLARDYEGETPLFKAVRYGRMEAFLYLHTLASEQYNDHTSFASISYCWRDDDQTILHNAIIRENFDLAFQIIHKYKDQLIHLADKEGDSPLHALARKPAAFKSGRSLRGLDKIIYDCLPVEELKLKEVENSEDKKNPENKQINFCSLVRLILKWRNAIRCGSREKEGENGDIESHGGRVYEKERRLSFSPERWFHKLVAKAVVFGGDMSMVQKIKEEKKKHVWANQVLDELLKDATDLCDSKIFPKASELLNEEKSSVKIRDWCMCQILETGKKKDQSPEKGIKRETAILLAAKYGIVEIIEKILGHFPLSIYHKDKESKNIVLIALENRHLEIIKFLLRKYKKDHIAFQKVDEKGNTALHYAAMYDVERVRPWPVPGAAMQIQWEIKWLEFMENAMPPRLHLRTNKKGHTPREMFTLTHKGLVKSGGDWLTKTAASCSVVATLIAGVAFSSSTSTPGDGTVKRDFTHQLFAICSLVSVSFSVTSLIMFLAILTSRHRKKDFGKKLPRKILFGLTSLFVSIAAVLVTFCAGHFLTFKDNFKYAVFPVYAVTLFPLCLFAAAQFQLYFDLMRTTFSNPFIRD